MANEFKHGSVGTELSQTEWEGVGTHVLDSQATGDIIYASSASQLSRLAKGTDGQVLMLASGIPSWAGSPATAADDITTGDSAVNLATTSGNITIDAQATDADVIIKVDDGGSPVTAVTFDGSAEGDAIFVNDIELKSDSSVLKFGTDLDTTLTHTNDVGLTLNSDNKLMFGDSASFIHQSTDGTLTIDGEAIIDLNASTRVDVSVDLKVGGEIQTGSIGYTDGDNSMTIADGGKVTFSAGFAVGSDASGDILYSNGTNYVRLAKGSDAQVLTLASGVPSWATPATGGGGNSRDFVASGAIANGKVVSLLSDGKVAVTASALGDHVVFETGGTAYTDACWDSTNGKVVVVYSDVGNTNYATCVVGTVSGMAITFGTPVVVISGPSNWPTIEFDSNAGKVVVAYADTTGKAKVGTVSGTSISFGSESAGYSGSGSVYYQRMCFDPDTNQVALVYSDAGDSFKGKCVMGAVSGTTVSWGTPVVFCTANTQWFNNCVYDTNENKVVVAFRDYADSGGAKAIIGTVSGTSISFGTAVLFEAGGASPQGMCFDSTNNKVIIAYGDEGNGTNGTAIVGTVSGTSISFGTAVVFASANTNYTTAVHDPDNDKIIIAYEDVGNSEYYTVIVGTVSGTSISFGSETVIDTAQSSWTASAYDTSADKCVLLWTDDGNSAKGTAVVFNSGATDNFLDWIGIAGEAISDGASGSIDMIGSVNGSQTSLTIDADYYVTGEGTITTSVASGKKIGRAVSATELLITAGEIS